MNDIMPAAVYALCALASLLCTTLQVRGYRQGRQRLQLLIGLCFAGLTINNILLPIDLVWLTREIDLSVLRSAVGLTSMGALLFVLIWETR